MTMKTCESRVISNDADPADVRLRVEEALSRHSLLRDNSDVTAPRRTASGRPGEFHPPGSHGTERESLPSLRSSHLIHQNVNARIHAQ